MVYRKSSIKVLLGPEKLRNADSVDGVVSELDTDRSPVRVGPRKHNDNQVFEKIGETNVYKRIRPFNALRGRPKLVRVPSNLHLSGQKVESEDTRLNLKSARNSKTPGADEDFANIFDEMDKKSNAGADKPSSENRDLQSACSYSPTLQRPKRDRSQAAAANTVSQNILTEFGLRTERTDTFSGHRRRRGASADMERQLEMSAERHIRTCQVVGNVKRSSRIQQSCQGLKNTVAPILSPLAPCPTERLKRYNSYNSSNLFKDKSFYRSDTSLDRMDDTIPYMIQIRRNVGSTPRIKPLGKPLKGADGLQSITSRTLIVGTSVQFS